MIPVWLDGLRADAVSGWRQINKRKSISAVAILSLGLATGACLAAFQLMDALFLRPLPVSHPQRLFLAAWPTTESAGDSWSLPRFRAMRAALNEQTGNEQARKHQPELIAVSFAEQTDLSYTSTRGSEMEKAYVQYVSGGMFQSLGLQPALGRLLTEDDDRAPRARPVAVLSWDYWSRRFGRNPKVVGSVVDIARKYGMGVVSFEIIGVAGRGFTGTEPGTQTELFVPAMMHPLADLPVAGLFRIFVHLPPDAAAAPVRDRLDAILHSLNQKNKKEYPYEPRQQLSLEPAASGISGIQTRYGAALAALGLLIALVLLIACANVANLKSAQAAARAREMALRVSIGAGRARLIRLVLVESAILALLAAAAGALFASQFAPFIVARINPPDTPARLSLGADYRVLGFGLALLIAVTLLIGVTPAWQASAVRPASALRGGENPRRRGRLMKVLLTAQAAFCFVVLCIAGLFAATFNHLTHQPAGFAVEHLLALDTVALRDEPPSAWRQVAERLRSMPGVKSVAVSEWPLLDGNGYRLNDISVEGAPPAGDVVRFLIVSPGWIRTMRIPLVKGRDLRLDETEVAIVNRAFVRKYFSGGGAIGKSFEAEPGGEWGHRFRIIGVVGDTRYRSVRDPIVPLALIPYRGPWHVETFMVRVAPSRKDAGPEALASILRQEVSRARPGFRVTQIRTQEGMFQAQTVRERLLATLGLFFAAIALLLAAVGLYGVLDYTVFQRRREIGLRMAIGAPAGAVVRRVASDIVICVAIGAFAGLAFVVGFGHYLESLLYQVKAARWSTVAVPGIALASAVTLASLGPLIRAVRTDPASVLRSE